MSERIPPAPSPPGGDLSSPEASVRAAAAEALANDAERARGVVPALVRACGDQDDRVREWVVAALESSGEPPTEALPDLIGLVGATEALVAYWATTLLGRCGAGAAAAVPALAARLAAGTPIEVRQRAAWALGAIGKAAAPARTALEEAARDADPRLSRLAGAALAALDA